jgi:hypothetical protein
MPITDYALRHPAFVAGASLGARYAVADVLQQASSEAPASARQFGAFGLFGTLYGSGPAYLIYTKLYPRLLGNERVVATAALDVAVHTPLLYFPVFYLVNAAVFGDTLRPRALARAAYRDWRSNLAEDVKMSILFWLPAHALNFYFVPLHLRVPAISGIGFFWAIGLSMFRGGDGGGAAGDDGGEEDKLR